MTDLGPAMFIDPGERKLHIVGQTRPWKLWEVRVAKTVDDFGQKLEEIEQGFVEVVDILWSLGLGPPVVFVESPAYAQANRAHQLGAVHGVIFREARRLGLACGHVPIGKVKKFATGNGSAAKPLVVSSIAVRTGLTFQTDDEADALAGYCFVMEALGRPHPLGRLPKTHMAALKDFALPVRPNQPERQTK
jgi:Holliday junction resolvasome RuvABC endonuclease subunit